MIGSILLNIGLAALVVLLLLGYVVDEQGKVGDGTVRDKVKVAVDVSILADDIQNAATALEHAGADCDKAARIVSEVVAGVVLFIGGIPEKSFMKGGGNVPVFLRQADGVRESFQRFEKVQRRVAIVCKDHAPYQAINGIFLG
jgi:hypothetical protein